MINALPYTLFGNEGRKERRKKKRKSKERISFPPFGCTREKKSE